MSVFDKIEHLRLRITGILQSSDYTRYKQGLHNFFIHLRDSSLGIPSEGAGYKVVEITFSTD